MMIFPSTDEARSKEDLRGPEGKIDKGQNCILITIECGTCCPKNQVREARNRSKGYGRVLMALEDADEGVLPCKGRPEVFLHIRARSESIKSRSMQTQIPRD